LKVTTAFSYKPVTWCKNERHVVEEKVKPMKQLLANFYHLELGIANAYLLRGKDTLSLVDTGGHGSLPKIEKNLAAQGFKLNDLTHILLTHGHWDHTGDLALLQQESNAVVVAHKIEAPLIRAGKDVRPDPLKVPFIHRRFGKLFDGQPKPGPVHREVEDNETLEDVYSGLRVVHLPGHSPGQVGYYCEQEGWLVGGDVMMHVVPHLTLPLALFTLEPDLAKQSVLKVAELNPKTLALGHGAPIVGKAHNAVARSAKRFR
jgi:glyoxylase-like metal-dependent hydrolase (beta-lactamase superfamily II)